VKGGENRGFRGIAEFLGLTEEIHIMVRRHIIQEVKEHRNNYVQVCESEDRFNYILNGLHRPQSSSGIALVDKWLTFLDMCHIVATYCNRLVVELRNSKINTLEASFPIRGVPPLMQKTLSCVLESSTKM